MKQIITVLLIGFLSVEFTASYVPAKGTANSTIVVQQSDLNALVDVVTFSNQHACDMAVVEVQHSQVKSEPAALSSRNRWQLSLLQEGTNRYAILDNWRKTLSENLVPDRTGPVPLRC